MQVSVPVNNGVRYVGCKACDEVGPVLNLSEWNVETETVRTKVKDKGAIDHSSFLVVSWHVMR